MNTDHTQQIVKKFLEYLDNRDLNNLAHLFSEQVDWYIPGDEIKVPWLGRRNTRQAIMEFYQMLWKNTEPLFARVEGVFIEKEKAVIIGEFSTRMLPTGKILDSPFCIEMHIRDNEIVKYRLLEDSFAVSQAMTK